MPNKDHQNRNFILFDPPETWQNLLPLTYTRPIADLRIGILTIRKKWEYYLQSDTSSFTNEYLQTVYPLQLQKANNTFINASVLPNQALVEQILGLDTDQAIILDNQLIALRIEGRYPSILHKADGNQQLLLEGEEYDLFAPKTDFVSLNFVWDIFQKNAAAIQADFDILTKDKGGKPRISQSLSSTNTVIEAQNIFVEEGASVEGAFLNASTGPIYIGKNALIMGGSMVRGPLAMCENSVLKLGTKIYGATTLGPHVKVGGEVNNSVIFGYSNKGHDGFLGNSVLGEWCNLGADTNNSNLKNTYGNIKMWSYPAQKTLATDLQFCGLIMGDHAKSGINTMFNTGTVVGVAANVFGADFPPKFIPSFSWGSANNFTIHDFGKAIQTAQRMYSRRNKSLSKNEKQILKTIFEETKSFRAW